MNKSFSALLAFCLLSTASLTFAKESMDTNGAMNKDAMKMEPMKKEGAMMKVQPKKMKRQKGKMEQGGGSMSMEPMK